VPHGRANEFLAGNIVFRGLLEQDLLAHTPSWPS